MEIIYSATELNNRLDSLRSNNRSIGFVPTMGALHAGHLSLIKRCKAENDICVISIFVNPTQFNNKKDLEKYPRTLEQDSKLLETVNCDYIFAPSAEDMYSEHELNSNFSFDFNGLDVVMEGKHRPGHFNGVVQIVSKLFKIVKPSRAYFGEKDFQQVAIVRHMTNTMNFPIEIISCPIIREDSGLAMSSRNGLLSQEELKIASGISKVLNESTTFVGSMSPGALIEWVTAHVNNIEGLEVEYFEIVDGNKLQPIEKWDNSNYIVGCITVFCGEVRLIDNIQYR